MNKTLSPLVGASMIAALAWGCQKPAVTDYAFRQLSSVGTINDKVWVASLPESLPSSLVGESAVTSCKSAFTDAGLQRCSTWVSPCVSLVVFEERDAQLFVSPAGSCQGVEDDARWAVATQAADGLGATGSRFVSY